MGYFIYLVLLFPLRRFLSRVLELLGHFIHPLLTISLKLDQFSTIFHEMCHYGMNKLMFIPVSLKDISFSDNLQSGSVRINYDTATHYRFSLMKCFLISLAPLFIGTWIVLFLVSKWDGTSLGGKIGIGLAICCLILGLQPSNADIKCIYIYGVTKRPWLALRQVICMGLASLFYLWQADFFMQFYVFFPILFEIAVILAIFILLDLICYGLDEVLRFLKNRTIQMTFNRSLHIRKYKIPLFAKPVIKQSRMNNLQENSQ
ncbi:hypothetical protein [Candidatus Lokiarchaeum ossiferum]|uniref:hypothetical protein n=1 Tax=Candidatus Lokiarchaeum ossiferum TaxID=2951803 RepID=UPI00352D06C8